MKVVSMETNKEYDRIRHMWVDKEEFERRQSDFADLVDLVCGKIAVLSMTRREVRDLFDSVQERLTYGGFNPIGKSKEAPTAQSSEPLET